MLSISRVSGIALLISVTGCLGANDRRMPPQRRVQQKQIPQQKQVQPKVLEIDVWTASGIYGGGTSHTKWILRPNGPSHGEQTFGNNANSQATRTVRMKLHSKQAYRHGVQLLKATSFFQMRDCEPEFRFESSSVSIQVRHGHQKHAVQVVSPAPQPPGFQRLLDFVADLTKQADKQAPQSGEG